MWVIKLEWICKVHLLENKDRTCVLLIGLRNVFTARI